MTPEEKMMHDAVMRLETRVYRLVNNRRQRGVEAIAMRANIRRELETVFKELTDQCADLRRADAFEAVTRREEAILAERQAGDARLATAVSEERILAGIAAMDARDKAAADQAAAVAAERRAGDARQAAAVDDARVQERAACAALRASDATTAQQAQASAVAAARTAERARCVKEIEAAPVSGITVALNLFAASMRTQIRNYVAAGPHGSN